MRNSSPIFRKTALFAAGSGGYAIYRIPGLVATPAGTLLVYCEARRQAGGDWGNIDLLLRRSADGGLTWSPPARMNPPGLVVPRSTAALDQGIGSAQDRTFNNPVAIAAAQPGLVHFVFCAEYARCFYRRSADDGLTWSEPVDITTAFEALRAAYPWRVIATGPGHGIQLRCGAHAGRLLAPVWLSDGTGGHAHRPSVVSTLYSDDGGAAWHCGEIAAADGPGLANPSESAAVELADGRVLLNIRSESPFHRRVVALSPDGAGGWSEPAPDPALFEPVCAAGLLGLPDGRLLFSNPDSRAAGEPGPRTTAWKRENLTVRLSEDEGKTWPASRVLDPGLAGYSDLAAAPDGLITCVYEGGGIGGNPYASNHITAAQFEVGWLYPQPDR